MSGDMRLNTLLDGALGTARNHDVIDAHHERAGDFAEGRTVQGRQVFLTRDGAAAFDDALNRGMRFEAHDEPTRWIDRLTQALTANVEHHQGTVSR